MDQLASLSAVLGFYALFLAVGIWAGQKTRQTDETGTSQLLLAGRRMPILVGAMTMTATWVGGGYINGTAEAIYDSSRGLLWAQAPWCYALSLILGGLFFAARMRRLRFTTLLDLFERRYGKRVAAVLYVPALLGEVFWGAAILAALGTAMSIVLGIDLVVSVWISAAVAVVYTFAGGLWAVAYTDVLQLVCIMVGLCVALAYALNDGVSIALLWRDYRDLNAGTATWLPPLAAFGGQSPWGWQWLDFALLLALGGIPWQVYFQRVLACKDEQTAVRLSFLAGIGCLVMAIPAGLIGMVGATTDWSTTMATAAPEAQLVLPYVLKYLTSPTVATIGLAAVVAAVMSSVDSSILSASSMFAWNIYRPLVRPGASDRETQWLMRSAVCAIGMTCAVLAIQVGSIYTLWFLCADLVYVLLFPQLVCALFIRKVNSTGAIAGCVVGLLLRLGGGEPSLGLAAWIPYPLQDVSAGTLFPFRTFAMIMSLLTTLIVSRFTLSIYPATDGEAFDRGYNAIG